MSFEITHRRNLPHWFVPNAAHFLTYRLAGTLPASVVREVKDEQLLWRQKPASGVSHRDHFRQVHKRLFAKYERHLDHDHSIDWLRDHRVAAVLRSNLYHHDGSKYRLLAYCLMPNHVHALLIPMVRPAAESETKSIVGETPDGQSPLSGILHSLKSYTANRANRILKRDGRFWQPESYDHWIRDEDELERVVNYIRANPVKAGLVDRPEDWYFSSCHDRLLIDGDTSGWLPT